MMRWVNEVLAFLLELAAFAALCYWGIVTGDGVPMTILLGAGAPLAAILLWWLFAAPRAPLAMPLPVVLLVKAIVFGAAALALASTGHRVLAVVFAALVVVNTTVITIGRRSQPTVAPR